LNINCIIEGRFILKIGVDLFSFDKPGENFGVGPGVYVWHLLPKLLEYGKDIQFYIFANKENVSLIPRSDNIKIIIDQMPSKIRSTRILHEQIFIPYHVKRNKIDIVHFLGNNVSYSIAKRSIITIYDLMWKYYLDLGDKNLKFKYFRATVPKSIEEAKGVITISSFIKQQVFTNFNKESNRIIPILLAPCVLKEYSKEEELTFSNLFSYNFIFTITTSLPHKNLITLLKAFNELKLLKTYSGKLVIAGQLKGNFHNQTINFIHKNNLIDDIVLLGFIAEELKTYLYTNADFVVYPSLYEGFGLPVLEAMQVGNTILASKAASIPEVGGDACLYFNPNSSEDLLEKMLYLIKNPDYKEKTKNKRELRLRNFSWDKTAKETLAAYKYFFEAN